MDALTKELERLLVRWHYEPSLLPHQLEHYMEHLTLLLPEDDRESLLHYFGVLGHEQTSLHELAKQRGMTDESMMENIDHSLRRLAITPEWQELTQKKA